MYERQLQTHPLVTVYGITAFNLPALNNFISVSCFTCLVSVSPFTVWTQSIGPRPVISVATTSIVRPSTVKYRDLRLWYVRPLMVCVSMG